jgi:hypothetical protein
MSSFKRHLLNVTFYLVTLSPFTSSLAQLEVGLLAVGRQHVWLNLADVLQ